MHSRVRRVAIPTAVLALFSVAAAIIIGCGTISPFLSAQFAETMMNPDEEFGLARGGVRGAGEEETPVGEAIDSLRDLPPAWRGLTVTVFNESQQYVRFSMTFAVSAGPGGFVSEDDDIQDYINAGYSNALVPGAGNVVTIGCDTLTLLSGNQLLTMEFGISEGDLATLAPGIDEEDNEDIQAYELRRRDNRSTVIPLPEIIVLGSDDPDFTCTGGAILGDLCSQRGFVYASAAGIPVGKAADASHIQGTVCNALFGTAPEWRLDKTIDTGSVLQPFQFAAGGTIGVVVLDRWNDAFTATRNQVVWLVTDGDGNTIHFPDP